VGSWGWLGWIGVGSGRERGNSGESCRVTGESVQTVGCPKFGGEDGGGGGMGGKWVDAELTGVAGKCAYDNAIKHEEVP